MSLRDTMLAATASYARLDALSPRDRKRAAELVTDYAESNSEIIALDGYAVVDRKYGMMVPIDDGHEPTLFDTREEAERLRDEVYPHTKTAPQPGDPA